MKKHAKYNNENGEEEEIASFFDSESGSANAENENVISDDENVHKMLRHPMLNDMDSFFTHVYEYYVHGGTRNFALSRLSYVAKYAITLALMFFLTVCVDYERFAALLSASSSSPATSSSTSQSALSFLQQQQQQQQNFTETNNATTVTTTSSRNQFFLSDFCYFGAGGTPSLFLIVFFIGFASHFVVLCFQTVRDIHVMSAIGKFYRFALGMQYNDVQTCEWDTVCRRLIRVLPGPDRAASARTWRSQRNKEESRWNELQITNRIMRHQNYMIALQNLNVLAWPSSSSSSFSASSSSRRDKEHDQKTSGEEDDDEDGWRAYCWNPLFSTQSALPPRRFAQARRAASARQQSENTCAKKKRNADEEINLDEAERGILTNESASEADAAHPALGTTTISQPMHFAHPLFTRTLELALHYGVFLFVFDPHRRQDGALRRELRADARYAAVMQLASGLRVRLRLMGAIGLLLCPFVLVYVLFGFFLEHGEQVRNRPQDSLATRIWSAEAHWTLREYNELPHLLRRRLNAAHEHATSYLEHFHSAALATAARFISFLSGAFVALLLLLAVDDALSRVIVALDRSALWWISVFGIVLAISRALIPPENAVFDPRGHLRRCARHTHYFPSSWRGAEHTGAVRDRFARLFEHRWSYYFREILSIVYTPYLLFTLLPQRSEAMMLFFRDYSVERRGCGTVVRFAAFDEVSFDAPPHAAASTATAADAAERKKDDAIRRNGAKTATFLSARHSQRSENAENAQTDSTNEHVQQEDTTIDEKMQRSAIGFGVHHPDWQRRRRNDGVKLHNSTNARTNDDDDDSCRDNARKEEEEEEFDWNGQPFSSTDERFNAVLQRLQNYFQDDKGEE